MLMILSPSKTQDFSLPPLTTPVSQPSLLAETAFLIRQLRHLTVPELASLMKMSGRLAELTHQRIRDFRLPFTADNARPALLAFQGDVYSAIHTQDYSQQELAYGQAHLRILSGLYGLLRPLDLIQAYRLEMGCRLATSRGQNLYAFWTEQVTKALNKGLVGQQEAIVVNLASMEYSKVISKKNLQGSILHIDFKERQGEGYRTVAIHAKRARGRMVDFAIRKKVETVAELKGFAEDGYRFRQDLSRADHYLFTRD
ncbi:MAG: peroxide stress protein YaaA [Proteobacteria bacterium]|nr:peroxide stress protein YaaA [Pseudomonadota bacterium]MBU1060806.1 peroxide stress protein YaaA [Pseudomonadota bacterium]